MVGTPIMLVCSIVFILALLYVIVYFYCVFTVIRRAHDSPFTDNPHASFMGLALFKLLFVNEVFDVTDRDDLVFTVMYFYHHGYYAGTIDSTLLQKDFDRYVARHCKYPRFYKILVRLMNKAYVQGKVVNDAEQMSHR